MLKSASTISDFDLIIYLNPITFHNFFHSKGKKIQERKEILPFR